MRCVTSDVVLEAEMVAFSDATERIDGESYPRFMSRARLSRSPEFWRIRSLIESTAVGPRHRVRKIPEETQAVWVSGFRDHRGSSGSTHSRLPQLAMLFEIRRLGWGDSAPRAGVL